MAEMTNELRAQIAGEALQKFTDRMYGSPTDRDLTDPESFDQALGDLLGDLHHFVGQQLSGPRADEWTAALLDEDVPSMIERAATRGRGYYEEELAERFAPVEGDAPDCSRCKASNAGSREAPYLCEVCADG